MGATSTSAGTSRGGEDEDEDAESDAGGTAQTPAQAQTQAQQQEQEDGGSDNEDDDEDDSEAEEMDAEEAEVAEHLRMAALLEIMTPEQIARYEHFRRSHLKRSDVSRVMKTVLPPKDATLVTEKAAIVVGGAAKVYAGELLEMARTVMEEETPRSYAVQPRHLREAYRRLRIAGKVLSRPVVV